MHDHDGYQGDCQQDSNKDAEEHKVIQDVGFEIQQGDHKESKVGEDEVAGDVGCVIQDQIGIIDNVA